MKLFFPELAEIKDILFAGRQNSVKEFVDYIPVFRLCKRSISLKDVALCSQGEEWEFYPNGVHVRTSFFLVFQPKWTAWPPITGGFI